MGRKIVVYCRKDSSTTLEDASGEFLHKGHLAFIYVVCMKIMVACKYGPQSLLGLVFGETYWAQHMLPAPPC